MATQGYVVAWVVLGFIFLITVIVWLATSPGGRSGSGSGGSPTGAGAPGSAGNWTAAQVAEQAKLFFFFSNAIELTKLGLPGGFVDKLAACVMADWSKRYGYDAMSACNTGVTTCQPTADDIRAVSSCMGGEKGRWSAELKSLIEEAVKKTMTGDPGALAAVPCIVGYFSSNYSFADLMAQLATGSTAGIENASFECAKKSLDQLRG